MFVSVIVLRSVVAELESRGHSATAMLRAAGLDRSQLADHAQGVRERDFQRLVATAIRLTRDPALGLTVGHAASPATAHVLGMLILVAPDLREAFRIVERHGSLLLSGIDWKLREDGESATIEFPIELDEESERFASEFVAAMVVRSGRHFAPRDPPLELRFRHAEPAHAESYRKAFHCPVVFGAECNAVVFKRSLLDRKQPHADTKLGNVLRDFADNYGIQANATNTLAERVRAALHYEARLDTIDWNGIAARLGLTPRGLRRRLSASGTPMTKLVEAAKCRRAVEELRRPDSQVRRIAEELGYSEPSAFHRAFKRWTGFTPGRFKSNSVVQSTVRPTTLMTG